jgi:hypothetical protein
VLVRQKHAQHEQQQTRQGSRAQAWMCVSCVSCVCVWSCVRPAPVRRTKKSKKGASSPAAYRWPWRWPTWPSDGRPGTTGRWGRDRWRSGHTLPNRNKNTHNPPPLG